MIKHEQLEDLWRFKNKDTKDYTFYSNSKNVWSRTDMIWLNKSMCPLVKKVKNHTKDTLG